MSATSSEVKVERSGPGFIVRIDDGARRQVFHCSSETMVRQFVAAFAPARKAA